jgi:hypothetical protein
MALGLGVIYAIASVDDRSDQAQNGDISRAIALLPPSTRANLQCLTNI